LQRPQRTTLVSGPDAGPGNDQHSAGEGSPGTRAAASPFDAIIDDAADRVAALVADRLAPLLERASAPALLDRRGLAEALNCCVDVVDRLRGEGMPDLRVGDVPRFELERVLEWLRRRK
jgi:hypothetical protein